MATIFEATHNTGPPVSDFYSFVSGSTDYEVSTLAALDGTAFGLRWPDVTSGNTGSVAEQSMTVPAAQQRLRFRFSTARLTIPASPTVPIGSRIFNVQLRNNPGSNTAIAVRLRWNTSGEWLLVYSKIWDGDGDITDVILHEENLGSGSAAYCVDCALTRASGALANDGEVHLFLDGVELFTDLAADYFNSASGLNQLDVQSPVSVSTITGDGVIDEVILTDDATAALCPAAVDEFSTGGLTAKPCDIDADGSQIYISALDNLSEPVLIQFSTDINADGTLVFNPGTGSNIGVQCGRFDVDTVWIAGDFGGTDTVEKSEDSGTSFIVKDPGTFGAVSAFIVGPDSDERVLIVDNGVDIQETIDDGGEWIAKNTGLTPVTKSLARLDINVEEVIFGNESGANDNVDYSVNTGADLEDLNLPVAADVSGVIVN